MKNLPTLPTERLLLRPFALRDAEDVQRLAGAYEVARSTFMPHPYRAGLAEAWIRSQAEDFARGRGVDFAITLRPAGELIGSIGMAIDLTHEHGQLGYWIGVPHWNRGYCTEAVRAVLGYGFETLDLHRIWAPHFTSNPASGRVLQKVGMTYEGCQREHYTRFGRFEDVALYGLLRREYEAA
jgi:ribosomal-protein-alanine N-acetyltransferase